MSTLAQPSKGPIEYRTVGQGPTILVLNGSHTDCHIPFEHERFFLDQGYHLLLPSRPGYGKTPASTGKTAEAFADALVSLLASLFLEKVIVFAISGAGPTALQLAGSFPERVTAMILENVVTGEHWPSLSTRFLAYLLFNPITEPVTWAGFHFLAKVAPQRALTLMMKSFTSLDPQVVVMQMSEEQRSGALRFLLSLRSGSGFLFDIWHVCGDLSRITTPTLVIASQYDGAVNPNHAKYAARHIKHAELFIVPAESHLL